LLQVGCWLEAVKNISSPNCYWRWFTWIVSRKVSSNKKHSSPYNIVINSLTGAGSWLRHWIILRFVKWNSMT